MFLKLIKILHCSDLHLSAGEKDYSFNVLKEITDAAQNTDFLVLCGDTFDTYADAETLRSDFRKLISGLECTVILLPGNHENLKSNNRKLKPLDFGNIIIAEEKPFGFHIFNNLEILTIPHNINYRNYTEWKVPEKTKDFRICMAHGTVSGITYSGPDEEGGAVIDIDLFRRFNSDYAALGHIHTPITDQNNNIYYPGSARIWRKGETGQRFYNIVEIDKKLKVKQIPLISSGQYREYGLLLSLEGDAPDISGIDSVWSEYDWIVINFTGIVEDEKTVSELDKTLTKKYSGIVRKFEINRENVSVLEGISSQVIAKKFLEAWGKKEHETKREIWLKSREIALNKIKSHLMAKK